MIIIQTSAGPDDILDRIDSGVRDLQAEGKEPRYIIVGPQAYGALRQAMAMRYGRSEGTFESYQWLSIVVDPFRTDEICVVPVPAVVAEGVRAETR